MVIKASITVGLGQSETLQLQADNSWVLQESLKALGKQFNWIWEKEYKGEDSFSTRVGTKGQWDNGWLGTIEVTTI